MSRFDIDKVEWPGGTLEGRGPSNGWFDGDQGPHHAVGVSVVPAAAYEALLEAATELAEAGQLLMYGRTRQKQATLQIALARFDGEADE